MDKSFKDPVNLHPLKVLVGNYKVRNFNHFKTIPDKNFWNYPFLPSFFAKERRNYFLGQVCISLLDHLTILLYIIPQLVLMILHYPLLFNPCSDGIKHGLHKSEWIKTGDQTYSLPLTEWCYQCWRLQQTGISLCFLAISDQRIFFFLQIWHSVICKIIILTNGRHREDFYQLLNIQNEKVKIFFAPFY